MRVKTMLPSLCILLTACATQTATGIKPGLWELRLLKADLEGRNVPAAVRSPVQRVCVSEAMVKGDGWLDSMGTSDGDCSRSETDRSGNRVAYEVACDYKDGASAIQFLVKSRVELVISEISVDMRVNTTATVVEEDSTNEYTIMVESQMKYLGRDCDDLETGDDAAPKRELADPE